MVSDGFNKISIKMCPETILAVKRTDRVIGRMIVLINSIKTKIGDNTFGLPNGVMWANIKLGNLNQPIKKKIKKKFKEKYKFIFNCLVMVNT